MPSPILKIPNDILPRIVCPSCKGALSFNTERFECLNKHCGQIYPVIDGVPVLINEANSLFLKSDFVANRATFFKQNASKNILSHLKKIARSLLPDLNLSVPARRNCAKFAELLCEESKMPKVLILGGGVVGKGLESIIDRSDIHFLETDVAFGPRTCMVCDGHDLPFTDGSFDGVLLQSVLEHVLDPIRCADEIHRVLRKDGLIYVETPFMQQVHGGKFDFTRYTYLGHRRLFRKFAEIDSGAVCGPAMAFSWATEYFLMSLAGRIKPLRLLFKGMVRLTLFWLKYLDYLLIRSPGAMESASSYYFLGRKSEKVLRDQDLIKIGKRIFG